MRLLIYARAQEAVPLYMTLKLDRSDPVCLLMGGMSQELVEREIRKFEDSPAAIMIATAAHSHSWRADVEAMVMFSENSFVMSQAQAANRVNEPRIPVPTPDMLLEAMNREVLQDAATLIDHRAADEYDTVVEPELHLPAPVDIDDCTPCNVRREGDEYVCAKCKLRWDVHEDQPPCPNL